MRVIEKVLQSKYIVSNATDVFLTLKDGHYPVRDKPIYLTHSQISRVYFQQSYGNFKFILIVLILYSNEL